MRNESVWMDLCGLGLNGLSGHSGLWCLVARVDGGDVCGDGVVLLQRGSQRRHKEGTRYLKAPPPDNRRQGREFFPSINVTDLKTNRPTFQSYSPAFLERYRLPQAAAHETKEPGKGASDDSRKDGKGVPRHQG